MVNIALINQQVAAGKGSSGITIAFPDVCKTPSPGGPVPIPYPNTEFQSNLQQANLTDAKAKTGDTGAKKLQKRAIDNLKLQTGIEVKSATAAVIMGRSVYKKSAGNEAGISTNTISARRSTVFVK
jgi:hypothetical protein